MEEVKTEDRRWCVYMHTNKINNKVYIGQTCQQPPEKRWGQNGCNYGNNEYFYRAIQKYGWGNFEHIIFAINLTKEEAYNMEILLIKFYDTTNKNCGYNICYGGGGSVGRVVSEESRRKNSESHLGLQSGENNPMYGKNHTDKTKTIIGDKARVRLANPQNNPMFGKHHTEEAKKKISEKAKNRTKEQRQKMSATLKSRFSDKNNLPDYLKCQAVVQLTTDREYISKYPSISEASRQTEIQVSHISACCKHKKGHHTAGGFRWLYLTEWEEIQNAENMEC